MVVYQSKTIEIKWQISGHEHYGFGTDKKLYNIKTGKEIKLCLKAYTKGYNISGVFFTLNKLRTLLIRATEIPF
jgi:hypothetical protein